MTKPTNPLTSLPAPRKPVNYLNNKDMLKEIHTSKNTWCSYVKPEDHRYDLIIDCPDRDLEYCFEQIYKAKNIKAAKEARAARLSIETGTKIDYKDIKDTDLVFRVMTWEHVPLAPKQPRKVDKKRSAIDIIQFDDEDVIDYGDLDAETITSEIDDMVHVRVNFPPFQHYKFTRGGNLKCVGKSHWVGDMKKGEFSTSHGQITNTLAKMYLEMCQRFSTKFNWRGYTYIDEMRGSAVLQLTYVGLRFNEAKSDNPFAYYTAAITNSFCRVLNTEKKSQNIRDDLLEMNGLNPSWSRQQQSIKTE